MKTAPVLYSKAAKKVVSDYLSARYSPGEAARILEETHRTYLEFYADIPELGGRKNRQIRGVCDSLILAALWAALPDKPSPEQFNALVEQTFVPVYHRNPLVNLNRKPVQWAAHKIFALLGRDSQKHRQDRPGNYDMRVEPYDPETGIHYRFYSCPMADFCKKHGLEQLMPALCNADYPMLAKMRGALIRTHTCAEGPYCDYWILGDQSPLLKEHPLAKDDRGFLKNQ